MPEVHALTNDDFDQGVEAFRLNKFTKAAACFKRALPHRTTDPRIYAYLGTIAAEQDNIVDAYSHYQALDQLIVSPQQVRLALAVLASRLGDQQASLRYLERAAAPDALQTKAGLSGQDEYDLLDIALAIYKDGSSQGFIALRQIVQDANPNLHEALEAVIMDCRGLEGETCIAQFCLRLLDQLPDHEFTPVLAAKWLSTLGRVDRVNQSLLSLVQADPSRHRCWVALGYLATASQNLQVAVRCYRQAIALTPSVDALYHTLADLLIRTGEFDEAEALIDRGLVAVKQKRSLKLLKVSLYNAQGLYDQALRLAQQIATENESLDEAWIVLAELFCARGFFGAAAALIQGIKEREVDERRINDLSAYWWRCQYQFGQQSMLLGSLWSQRPQDLDLASRLMTAKLLDGDVMGALQVDQRIDELLEQRGDEAQRMAWRQGFQRSILREFNTNQFAIEQLASTRALSPQLQIPRLLRALDAEPGYTGYAIMCLIRMRQAGYLAFKPKIDARPIPQQIYQYWDDNEPPAQIEALMKTWQIQGWQYQRYDDTKALVALRECGNKQAQAAFECAAHPSLRADLLRLAVLAERGGYWADADDRRFGPMHDLQTDGSELILIQENVGTLGNNFIACTPGHPFMRYVLAQVVERILCRDGDNLWFLSGPGALTLSFCHFYRNTLRRGQLPPGVKIMDTYTLSRTVAQHLPMAYKDEGKHWNHQRQRHRSLFRKPKFHR